MQHPSAVLVEDDPDDDNFLISSFIKGKSKPSSSMHFSIVRTHASRMSEGDKKKREIKEQRVSEQNERQPNLLAKGEGLDHVQSEPDGATILKALGFECSIVRSDEVTLKYPESGRTPTTSRPQSLPSIPKRLRTDVPAIQASYISSSLEENVVVMNDNLNSLSQSVADGFSKIQVALDYFSKLLHAANLPKGEKSYRSNKGELDDELVQGDQPGDSFQPPDQPSKESQGKQKEIGGAGETSKGEREASGQGEQGEQQGRI